MQNVTYDPRDYTFVLYYDQQEHVWVAEVEGTTQAESHPTSHHAALALLEQHLQHLRK